MFLPSLLIGFGLTLLSTTAYAGSHQRGYGGAPVLPHNYQQGSGRPQYQTPAKTYGPASGGGDQPNYQPQQPYNGASQPVAEFPQYDPQPLYPDQPIYQYPPCQPGKSSSSSEESSCDPNTPITHPTTTRAPITRTTRKYHSESSSESSAASKSSPSSSESHDSKSSSKSESSSSSSSESTEKTTTTRKAHTKTTRPVKTTTAKPSSSSSSSSESSEEKSTTTEKPTGKTTTTPKPHTKTTRGVKTTTAKPSSSSSSSSSSSESESGEEKSTTTKKSTTTTTKKPTGSSTTTKKPTGSSTTTKKPTGSSTTTEKPTGSSTTTRKPAESSTTTRKPAESSTTTRKPAESTTSHPGSKCGGISAELEVCERKELSVSLAVDCSVTQVPIKLAAATGACKSSCSTPEKKILEFTFKPVTGIASFLEAIKLGLLSASVACPKPELFCTCSAKECCTLSGAITAVNFLPFCKGKKCENFLFITGAGKLVCTDIATKKSTRTIDSQDQLKDQSPGSDKLASGMTSVSCNGCSAINGGDACVKI